MIRITLTDAHREELEQTFKTTAERYLRDRCQAVLMAARGRKRGQIAEDLHVHRVTVQDWLRQYRQGGVGGLVIHWGPGQPARIPQELAPEILKWVKEGPRVARVEPSELDLCGTGPSSLPHPWDPGSRDHDARVLPSTGNPAL